MHSGSAANAMRWTGEPGHYEVWYLSLTDPATGCGLWVRYTMLAPQPGHGEPTCALWLMLMDPADPRRNVGRKATFPIGELVARSEPFRLSIAGAELTDQGMSGAFEDVAWDLRWAPGGPPRTHVHPALRAARVPQTILVLPHPDVEVSGTVTVGDRTLAVAGARGGQAHLWGTKHAARWAWLHCGELRTPAGEARPGDWIDGVSVVVTRLGREVGPSTPVIGRIGGRDFASTSPLRVIANPSRFGLTTWAFQATDGARRLVGEVDARREDLVGVTYHDPDGEDAYCYNSEVADLRLSVYERAARVGRWTLTDALVAPGRAHFESADRWPVPGQPLFVA